MSIQKSQLYKIARMGMEVNIPQIVLGESLAIIVRETSSDDLKGKVYDLMEWVKDLVYNTGSCVPSINQEMINMANEIKDGDSLIDVTDAIFVSHAIVDPDARFVFTTDTKIQNSRVIYDKLTARQEGWSKLSITDSVPGS